MNKITLVEECFRTQVLMLGVVFLFKLPGNFIYSLDFNEIPMNFFGPDSDNELDAIRKTLDSMLLARSVEA